MDDEHINFCISWFTIRVTNVGITMAISAWLADINVVGKGPQLQKNSVHRTTDDSFKIYICLSYLLQLSAFRFFCLFFYTYYCSVVWK